MGEIVYPNARRDISVIDDYHGRLVSYYDLIFAAKNIKSRITTITLQGVRSISLAGRSRFCRNKGFR